MELSKQYDIRNPHCQPSQVADPLWQAISNVANPKNLDQYKKTNIIAIFAADVAELADAQASGACGLRPVEVRVLSSAVFTIFPLLLINPYREATYINYLFVFY